MIQAAELLKKGVLKPEQLEILDRGKDYGGVWNAATYPGAGCDVFSILYEISSFRNPGINQSLVTFMKEAIYMSVKLIHHFTKVGRGFFQGEMNLLITTMRSQNGTTSVPSHHLTPMSLRLSGRRKI